MILPVVEGQALASGVRIIVGAISLSALKDRIKIPWRDARTKEGYQRRPAKSRIAKLMGEIRRNRVDIPTAVLLNADDPSWEHAVDLPRRNAPGAFDLESYSGQFSVVDGQHRLLALTYLYNEDRERYSNFKVQFVMMLGATENQELEQFYIVNSTAKSVKTDLAFDLLKQRADLDGGVMKGLIESGQDWKVRAQALTEDMADNSEIWRRKIRLANEERGITTIPSSSFVTSLQKFLTYPFIEDLAKDVQLRLIETYWEAIRDVMPSPFKQPERYTLQKGIGVWAMHFILPTIIEIIRSRGESLFDSENYGRLLETMFDELEGENNEAELVKGHEFWLTAPRGGAAGSFSSSAGKRVLISKMRQALPRPEIE